MRLTRGEQVVSLPAWSGDGLRIAYAASPLAGGSFDIWTTTLRRRPALARGGRPSRAGGPVVLPAERSRSRCSSRARRSRRSGATPARRRSGRMSSCRLRPAGTVSADHRRDEARFRLATDNVGEGPVWVRGRRSTATGMREPARPHVRPLRPRLRGRRPPPLHAVLFARTGISASSATSCARSTASSSSATARAASASPTTTGSRPGA